MILTLLAGLALADDDVVDARDAIHNPDPGALNARVDYQSKPIRKASRAKGIDELQKSKLKVSEAALERLDANQVVITEVDMRSFGTAYEDLYHDDLRVFISADSILNAMHRTFDDTLEQVELQALSGEMHNALESMRAELASMDTIPEETRADADLYLTVAHSLLRDKFIQPRFADPDETKRLFKMAKEANGSLALTLFGSQREVDASQFTPRGHYRTRELSPYFRAMMWLGRIDFRPVEMRGRKAVFNRRQFDGAALITLSCREDCIESLDTVDRVVEAFVGPPDSMDTTEFRAVLSTLGAERPDDLEALDDDVIFDTLQANVPPQMILSHMLADHDTGVGEDRQLPVSFLPMGQRYIVDSYVMSETVYGGVKGKRMMPDPLDVAYAALGNDDALRLIDDLSQHGDALLRTRGFVDSHDAAYWDSNLYTRWLRALRAMSPDEGGFGKAAPPTELWGRRVLNTQLASWAELRHDTLLYAKQSYTSMALCSFPDAWVEPVPEFWDAVGAYGEHFQTILETAPLSAAERKRLSKPQEQLVEVADVLGAMARNQEAKKPHTAGQMRFLNQAVVRKYKPSGCTSVLTDVKGWYPSLLLDRKRAVEYDPTIADVHTQPTDEAGNRIGKVLHVGTGAPRLMVFTVDTCAGPTAFAGPVSTYYEVETMNFERLNDGAWAGMLRGPGPRGLGKPKPELEPWIQPVLESAE